MTILKTYARMFVRSLDESLPFLEVLVGKPSDLRFAFGQSELAAIGDLLVIAGPPQETGNYRDVTGPFIVSDMDEVETLLRQHDGVITQPRTEVPTGIGLWATHADGAKVEYVQWLPALVERIITPRAE
jgi:hypothetical protein